MNSLILWATLALVPFGNATVSFDSTGCPECGCCGCCETGECRCTFCTCECCVDSCERAAAAVVPSRCCASGL